MSDNLPPLTAAEFAAIRARLDLFTRQYHQTPVDRAIGETVARLLATVAALEAERDAALARQNRLECLLEVVTLKHQDACAERDAQAAVVAAALALRQEWPVGGYLPAGFIPLLRDLYAAVAALPGEDNSSPIAGQS